MSSSIREKIVVNAFLQAYNRERPEAGLIIHTDQGSQSTGHKFQNLLHNHNAISSVSRKGNPYDNELVNDAKFSDHEQARVEIFKYIELYYNSKRLTRVCFKLRVFSKTDVITS